LRLSIIAYLGIETQANKIKLRTSSEGAMKSRGALSARWERVSRQSSPFQGREPHSSLGRRGKRQSKEDHLSLQTVASVLRHFLGKSSQDLLLSADVLLRAAVVVLCDLQVCVHGESVALLGALVCALA
jgi:hypothetical protein